MKHIKKGDQVKVLSGKDRGKTGTVARIFPDRGRVLVDGVNMFKKRTRPKKQGEKGEVVLVARPIAASNAILVCKNCKAPTRVAFRMQGEKKVRYCKRCESIQD